MIGLSVVVYSLIGGNKPENMSATETAASQLVTVPNLVGKTYEEAKALLEKEGLTCDKTETYDATVEKGVVISQDKRPDEMLKKGSKVVLTVSLGEEGETTESETEEPTDADSSESNSKSTSSNTSSNDSDEDSDSDSSKTSHSVDDSDGGFNGGSGSSSSGSVSDSVSGSAPDPGSSSASGADPDPVPGPDPDAGGQGGDQR